MSKIYEFGIVGMGPAGLGMAITLQHTVSINDVICFERGHGNGGVNCPALERKNCCYSEKCAIISGIGGASTVSSGKLSSYPAGSGLSSFFASEQELISTFNEVISYFSQKVGLSKVLVSDDTIKKTTEFYKQKGIEYKYYDVYEFDGNRYREFIHTTMQDLQNNGLNFVDNADVVSIARDSQTKLFYVRVRRGAVENVYVIKNLVLATGALDIQDKLISTIKHENDCLVEIGVRVEVPTQVIKDTLATHGDLKLKLDKGRTYCVTVDGNIIAYYTGGVHFLEGCIDSSGLSGFTNLAILVKHAADVVPELLTEYQRLYRGIPVVQSYADYVLGKISTNDFAITLTSYASGDINALFPFDINKSIKHFIHSVLVEAMGIPPESIVLAAPELKILRQLRLNHFFELEDNLFVIGAATGQFRGILQSFISGVRCGQTIARG